MAFVRPLGVFWAGVAFLPDLPLAGATGAACFATLANKAWTASQIHVTATFRVVNLFTGLSSVNGRPWISAQEALHQMKFLAWELNARQWEWVKLEPPQQ